MSEYRRHFSHSQLNMYQKCGEQYRRRYIEGEIIAPGIAMIRGSSVHKAHEIAVKKKFLKEPVPTQEEMESIASDEVDLRFHEEYKLEEDMTHAEARSVTKDHAVQLAALDHQELIPQIQPIAVEEKIEVQIPGISKTLLGFLDVVENGRVRDLKTKTKSPPKHEASQSSQLSMYHLLYEIKYGKPPGELVLDVLVAKKEPALVQQTTWRMKEEIQIFLNRVYNAVENIGKGVFLPSKEDQWWCSEKWCGFWDTCPFGGQGRKRPKT